MKEAKSLQAWRGNLPTLLTGALASWCTLGGGKELEEIYVD
jgi:hypothetical protein